MKLDINVNVNIQGNDLAKAIENLSLGLIGLRFPRSLTFVHGGEEIELKKTLHPNQLRKELQKQAELEKEDRQEGLEENKPRRDRIANAGNEPVKPQPAEPKPKAKAKPAEAKPAEAKPAEAKPAEVTPEVTDTEVVEITQEEVTAKAKELIGVSSPAVLRAVLDEVIGQGVKISGAPKSKYQEIVDACEAKIAELS